MNPFWWTLKIALHFASRLCLHTRFFTVAALTFSIVFLTGCEKYALDWQMKELCEKDGGVVVYEVVTLPPQEFNKEGIPLYRYWLDPKLLGTSQRLGPDYRYVKSHQFIKSGDPLKGEGRLTRYVLEIYRTRDGRLLGKSISYGRSGGDFIVFGHPSNAGCPNPEPQLLLSLFQRGEK